MPPRRQSQHLHLDEGLPQTSTQIQSTAHPPTQTLSTIIEGSEHPTFDDIPKFQLHQLDTMSTTTGGSSQNGGGVSSTQTNGGDLHKSSRGYSRQYKSFRATLSLIRSKCKTRTRKLKKMRPQQRRSWSGSSRK
jgi:hypothetical protein